MYADSRGHVLEKAFDHTAADSTHLGGRRAFVDRCMSVVRKAVKTQGFFVRCG